VVQLERREGRRVVSEIAVVGPDGIEESS
jgi:hypothetical protein